MPYPFRPRSHLCESHHEEVASTITHAVGLALSIAGLVAMILVSNGDPWRVVSASIFGATLILLYLSSTLYHAFSGPRTKAVFQILDHACIYLLIAGSYTPVTLVTLRGPWGWSLFGVVWFLAIAGVLMKSLLRGKKETWWSTAIYLAMGWLLIIAIEPVLRLLSVTALAWLVAGGLSYTLGIVFFAWERLRFNHAIWHLFVLLGSACHVIGITQYVLR